MTVGNGRHRGYVVDIGSLTEAIEYAKIMASTDMVPDNDRGKPGNILAKMQIGAEIGLPPMQAVQTLYVHRGKVGMEVKGMLALIEASGLMDWWKVEWSGGEPQTGDAIATVKRVGRDPYTIQFGEREARKAGLIGGNKDTYTKWDWRMFYNRALGFALQDQFQDVLRGTVSMEYLRDSGVNVEATDLPDNTAQIEGRPVRAALMPPDQDLQPVVVAKMERLGMRPGQRLARLKSNAGRLDSLNEELDAELAKKQPGSTKAEESKAEQSKAPEPSPQPEPGPTSEEDDMDAEADRVLSQTALPSDAELDAEIMAMDARR